MKINLHNFSGSFVKFPLRAFLFSITVVSIFGVLLVSKSISQKLKAETTKPDQKAITETANEILANRHCPCQCGNYLPGSPKFPTCFGCSVSKAEITHVLESLEAERKTREIIMDLNSLVLIDVFADYTNKNISKVWQRVKRVSNELHQTRVVLRTPGSTVEARRATKLAECARLSGGKFSIIQEALINHQGPWDKDTLIRLAVQYGQDLEQIQACLDEVDIEAQIIKDQQHAEERGVRIYPTITINRQMTSNTDPAIRQAIEKILLEGSI